MIRINHPLWPRTFRADVGIRPYAAGEGENPRLRFCSRGKIYPCFFRFSELLARTAEVIWMKSLTYFFTFSPLR